MTAMQKCDAFVADTPVVVHFGIDEKGKKIIRAILADGETRPIRIGLGEEEIQALTKQLP